MKRTNLFHRLHPGLSDRLSPPYGSHAKPQRRKGRKAKLVKVVLTSVISLSMLLSSTSAAFAQGTSADYQRATNLRLLQALAVNIPERANWIGSTSRFWYRKSVRGGEEFVLVDAEALTKKPAFDHERLAASLSAASGQKYTALKLPFNSIRFVDDEKSIEFTIGQIGNGPPPPGATPDEARWTCGLSDYTCKKLETDQRDRSRGQGASLARGIPGP